MRSVDKLIVEVTVVTSDSGQYINNIVKVWLEDRRLKQRENK